MATLSAVRAEATKIITLPSLVTFSAVVLLLCLGIQAASLDLSMKAMAGIDSSGMIEFFTGSRSPAVQVMTDQLISGMFTTVPLVPVAGALLAGSEFRTGQIGVSLMGTPSRVRLLVAKVIATAAFAAAVCCALALLTSAIMFPVVKDWNPGILVSSSVLSGYLRATLIAVCTTVMVLGITLMTRRAVTGILVLAVFLGATISQLAAAISPTLDAALPVSAARNLLFYYSPDIPPPLTSGPWAAALVLIGWAVVAVVASGVSMRRRDAR